jgi:dienelactone hydrolase
MIGARRLLSALLVGGAAACACGALARAAAPGGEPEQKVFRTIPRSQLVAYVYGPPAGAAPSNVSPVLFYSGEWGWRPLQRDTASSMSSAGRVVLGIDSALYFNGLIPPDGLAADLAQFRAFVNERASRPKDAAVILVGFAWGAEMIPYLLNRAGASGVKGLVLIAPDKKGANQFRVSIQLKMDPPPGEQFDVGEELRLLPALPVVLIEGSLDKDSAAKALSERPRGPRKYAPVVGGDRQFHDVRPSFFAVLADALRWIDGVSAPTAPSGAPTSVPR